MSVAGESGAVLVFGYGNPSRGDDALGPGMLDLLGQWMGGKDAPGTAIALLTDFQLQVEHALDLAHRDRVLFVDASARARAPFEFARIMPGADASCTTHSMSPAAVLRVYEQIFHACAPPCFMLSVRGYEFGLGTPLSAQAADNLRQGFQFVQTLMRRLGGVEWDGLCRPGAG